MGKHTYVPEKSFVDDNSVHSNNRRRFESTAFGAKRSKEDGTGVMMVVMMKNRRLIISEPELNEKKTLQTQGHK